jgi:hypothetical protein
MRPRTAGRQIRHRNARRFGRPRVMTARLLADALVAVHFTFIAFVLVGGLLAARQPRWALLHLPTVAWAAWTEFTATVCPLTPWENALREAAGDAGYAGGFVEHYVVPLIYPEALTPRMQFALGIGVVALNAVVYALAWRTWRGRRPAGARPEIPGSP